MKLLIISHTEHYKTSKGKIVGWGPTVNEINHLTEVFDEIYHAAMLHDDVPPKSALPYTSSKIKFVELPVLGGKTIEHKLNILWKTPKTIGVVRKTLNKVDCFQLRTPTGIGVFLIPYLTLFSRKKGWFKYAGNWNQINPPLGYRLQRWSLKQQFRTVTINGAWSEQPKHCLTFENPCLTQDDLEKGQQVTVAKTVEGKINFCYVGRLERPKGVERIINGFMKLSQQGFEKVGTLHLVGDGPDKNVFIQIAKNTQVDIRFHGFLARDEVFEIYKQSHFFLMPTTASEGFPKVIAEAYNFGCVPIVSEVSAIAQYVKHKINGYIINPVTDNGVLTQLDEVLKINNKFYQQLLKERSTFVEWFTYDYYNRRILEEVLKQSENAI